MASGLIKEVAAKWGFTAQTCKAAIKLVKRGKNCSLPLLLAVKIAYTHTKADNTYIRTYVYMHACILASNWHMRIYINSYKNTHI